MTHNRNAILVGLIAYAVYAGHDAVIKNLGGIYNPIQILFFSVMLGFPLVILNLASSREAQSLRPSDPWRVGLRSALMVSGGICGFTTFTLLPMAQAYVMIFGAPLIVTVLARIFLDERLGWHRGIAVITGMAGVIIALNPGNAHISLGHITGILAAFSIAGIAIMTRILRDKERPIVLLLYPMLANLFVTGALLPWVYTPMPLVDLAQMALVALLALVAARMTIAAFSIGEASVVAPMQYSQILWAAFYGAVFFSEAITTNVLIGATIVIGSGIYILYRENKRKSSPHLLRGRSRGYLNPISQAQPPE